MKNLDDASYIKFCGPQIRNKALSTLSGIVDGISMDQEISNRETAELRSWCDDHSSFRRFDPFNELIAKIEESLEDAVLDPEEIEDIKWFLHKACGEHPFYDALTGELQYLQGLIHGILADGIITESEVNSLTNWMHDHPELAGCYPFDEIYAVLLEIMKDKKIDSEEHEFLKAFFSEFATLSINNQVRITSELKSKISTLGVCAVDPEILFPNKIFTFTGFSIKGSRKYFADCITSTGATFNNNIVKDIDYLIYGSGSNPFWAYSCYGRKVEKVMQFRKAGSKAIIVHENDFWDAYACL